MYTPLHRMTIVTALTFALFASVMSGAAVARPIDMRTVAQTSSLAGMTESQDQRSRDASEAARLERIALAQERYYSTYGEPKPLPIAEAPAPAPVTDPEPWLPIAVAVAAMLAIVAASVTVARRRRVTA